MLCYPFEQKRLKTWQEPWLIQPKLDGDRARALRQPDGKWLLVSSEENPIAFVPHINKELERILAQRPDITELDGELYTHGMEHNNIHSIVSRTALIHPEYDRLQYHIFDIVNNEAQMNRTSTLFEANLESDVIKTVDAYVCRTYEEIMEKYDTFLNHGYEGFVIRHMWAPYVRKRATTMMKFKPKKIDIYQIIGFAEEISIHGEPKNALGAFKCRGTEGGEFEVGTGFTREQRITYWKNRVEMVGKFVEVKYQHISTKGRVPRFPVFSRVIEDFHS